MSFLETLAELFQQGKSEKENLRRLLLSLNVDIKVKAVGYDNEFLRYNVIVTSLNKKRKVLGYVWRGNNLVRGFCKALYMFFHLNNELRTQEFRDYIIQKFGKI